MPRLSDISDRFPGTVPTVATVAKANEINGGEGHGMSSVAPLATLVAYGDSIRNGTVYVIVGADACVKIGWTLDIRQRKRELQSGSSIPLHVAYVAHTRDYRRVERLVHKELKDHRVSGEWFRVPVEKAIEAIDRAVHLVAKGYGDKRLRLAPASRPRLNDARKAILEFIADSMGDDGPTSFKTLRFCYDRWRDARGWPELSDRTLSEAMQAVGCTRTMVDGRKRGRGRYVAFELPRRPE